MPKEKKAEATVEKCPKCGAPLAEVTTTPSGKKLQRCSKGSWNPETRQTEGCDYVKWLDSIPEKLDEKCPKCGAPLVMMTTRTGKKMKKCSTAGWDRETRTATGCDYIQWINGTRETIDEKCPLCDAPLVLMTTATGKKMKKCSTPGWNRQTKQATGCIYVQWLNDNRPSVNNGDENFPSEEI